MKIKNKKGEFTMIARIKGTVVKSIQPEGKKMFKTAIMQRDEDMQTVVMSTNRGYKPGEKLNIEARVTVSMFREKAYLVIIEENTPETGETAEKTK